jgi:hypothetical protein
MRLFNKNQPAPVAETSYDDVVTYLRDLEQADYTKILKVVTAYRDADKKVKKILGIKDSPVSDTPNLDEVANILMDDDTDLGDFLEDEPPKKVVINKKPKETKKK